VGGSGEACGGNEEAVRAGSGATGGSGERE